MHARCLLLSASLTAIFLITSSVVSAAVITGGGLSLVTTATGPRGNTAPTIDVSGSDTLLTYTASGTDFGAPFDLSNLNDDDLGASDGLYAILAGTVGSFELDFGGSQSITQIAIYMGYGNRDDGSYTIKDAASAVVGTFDI